MQVPELLPTPRRRITAALAAAALSLLPVSAAAAAAPTGRSAPVAASADGCTGNGCDDRSPETTGCETAGFRVVTYAYVEDTRLELRWSDTCKAGWAAGEVLQLTSLKGVTAYIEKYDENDRLLGSSSVPIAWGEDQKNLSTMRGGSHRYSLCWKVEDPFGPNLKECGVRIPLS
jgi:hypothetical protein